MLTAGTRRLTIQQGATFDHTVTWYDGPGQSNPHDLTGYSAEMEVRDPDLDPSSNLVLDLTTVNGRIVLGGVAGTIQLVVAAADTAVLSPAVKSKYTLELTSPAGVVTRLLQGTVNVTESQVQ